MDFPYLFAHYELERTIELIDRAHVVCYSNVRVEPFKDTIYIDCVPVIEYKSGTDGFLVTIR